MKHSLLLLAVVALVGIAAPAQSQYMYLDVDGNGICDENDVLGPATTSVDVWLDTDSFADGSPATCVQSGAALNINSYEVILHATGALTYGTWTDNLTFTSVLGDAQAGGDLYVGRGSSNILAPGLHKLGSVSLSGVATGATLEIAMSSGASAIAQTAFGTACEGVDFINTYKLGSDWNDVCGTATATPVTSTTWGQIKNIYR